MKNLKSFFSLLFILIAASVLFSSVTPIFASKVNGKINLKTEISEESIVIGHIRDNKPVIAKKTALQKALNNHYKEKGKVTDLRIARNDNKVFLVATAKEKNGNTIEIAYQLERNGNILGATNAASNTCSGCSHCAFKTGGGCDCVEDGACTHSTTQDSLMDILGTQNF